MCPHGLGPRLCIELSAPEIRKAVLRAENRKYRAQEPAAGGSRGGAKGGSKPTTRYARSPPWIDFTYSGLNPSQPSAGAVRTQSLRQRGPMHPREELLPPVQLPQRADAEPRTGNAGLAPGFQVLSPITGKEKTPGDRLRPALSKRFNLARLPSSRNGGGWGGGARQTAIYLRPLADMRKW